MVFCCICGVLWRVWCFVVRVVCVMCVVFCGVCVGGGGVCVVAEVCGGCAWSGVLLCAGLW